MSMPAAASPVGTDRLLSEILDELPITDRVYHDLKYTQPLVERLLDSVRDLKEPKHVLVVACNTTLAAGLSALGHRVELWQPLQSLLYEGVAGQISRRAGLDALIGGAASTATRYDVVILPYVLEATMCHPKRVLGQIRETLKPNGRLIIAYRQSGALKLRLRALAGLAQLELIEKQVGLSSFSWPPLAQRRVFGLAELEAWAREAGFWVTAQKAVCAERPTHAVTAMSLREWLGAAGGRLLGKLVPRLRDSVVATLVPLAGTRLDPNELPRVSVIASVSDQAREARLLEGLTRQNYPRKRFEVILLRDARLAPTKQSSGIEPGRIIPTKRPCGPTAANEAVAAATGELLAFTDDRCTLPRGWIETGVGAMQGWTAAATGRVVDDGHSPRAFLTLPGARPNSNGESWFSSANSFFRRRAVLDTLGFDERFDTRSGGRVGWDNELAHRLEAKGHSIRVASALTVTRSFPIPRRLTWIGQEFSHSRDLVRAVAKTPSMRRELLNGRLFATRRTMWFDLMVAGIGLAAASRRPIYMALCLPWLFSVLPDVPIWPPGEWNTSMRLLRGLGARHFVWMLGLVAGSVTMRRLVL